ncbi:hypothetical protein FJY71_03600 [candidate division WOR-3 bacterium]|nr:hypothetical protein [candidate division WOR-3 bacterium]
MNPALLHLLVGIFNPLLSVGPDAMRWNPAQLALPERPGFCCRILGLSAGLENNAFTFGQYNHYTGALLDEKAKHDILGSIPDSGLALRGTATASAADFGFGSLAVVCRTFADADANLPRDLFDLALYGNRIGRVYSAASTGGRAQVLFRAGLGFGVGIGQNLTIGAAGHMLRGLFYAELTGVRARFVTTPQALAAEVHGTYRLATGGNGWAVDAGATWRNQGWVASAAVLDVNAGVDWTEGVEEGVYAFQLDSSNAYEMTRGDRFSEDFGRSTDGRFTTYLPVRTTLGIGRRFFDWLNAGMLLDPLWDFEPVRLRRWQTSVVVEAWPLRWLPLGCALSYRSGQGMSVGLDAAAIAGRFVFSAGFEDFAGLLLGAKGAGVRLGVGYGTFNIERRAPGPEVFRLRHGVN